MTGKKIKIRNNQVEIYYNQQGEGNVSLLFIHGWCINSSYWDNQMAYFAKANTVYAIDLPGFGKSSATRKNWSIEEYANDVNAFIEILDLKNVILIGHSMSGYIALQASLSNNSRISGLVGVDNFKSFNNNVTSEQMKERESFFHLLKNDFKNTAPTYAENMLFHTNTSTEIKERIKNDFSSANPKIACDSLYQMLQFIPTVTRKLENIQYKLHLINSNSTPTNETDLKKYCKKGYNLDIIDSTGHFPMNEKSSEFNERLNNIIKNISN